MQKNYNENLVAGAAIRDDKGRRISKLFEGSHPKMTVGYAKNLIMPDDPTEQEFNFRQAGGGVIEDGVAVIDRVKGNSVVWNQAFNRGSTFNFDGLNVTYNQTTKFYDCRGNNTESQIRATGIYSANFKSGDIIMRIAITKNFNVKNVDANNISCINFWNVTQNKSGGRLIYNKQGLLSVAISEVIGDNGDRYFCYYDVDLSIGLREETDTLSVSYAVYNLTQMFGAGNEPTTYEEFLQRKPKVADEFAYNEGTIVNNKVEKVVTTGRNLWDEEWENGSINATTGQNASLTSSLRSTNYIRIFAQQYYFKKPKDILVYIYCYDADKNYIGKQDPFATADSGGMFTPLTGSAYIRFTARQTTYNNDICINVSDPVINGKYFPYEEHTLDLSWIKEIKDGEGVKLFEDGIKSAGTAFNEVGKNKAIKRIGVKVFDGTESFTDRLADYGSFAIMRDAFVGIGSSIGISNRYVVSRLWEYDPDRTKGDKQIYIDSINNRVWIRDSAFADVDSLKQHLADLYAAGTPLVLYYELAEPIEVEYDEKNLTYPVVAGGTEEAIASEPSTAFRADIGYGIDAVKTILDLKARVAALEGK